MEKIILIAIVVIVAGLFFWQRRRVVDVCIVLWEAGRVLTNAIVSPQYNNRILIGLWLFTAVLFINAVYQGGGESLGFQALRDVGKSQQQESSVAKYYYDTNKYVAGEESKNLFLPKAPTWLWWKLWLFFLFISIIYIPIAFWDEVLATWNRAREVIEQRSARIDLRPKQVVVQNKDKDKGVKSSNFWQGFKERFISSFSADMISESIFEFGGKMLRRLLKGG
ncbi:hypothetical protein HZB04_01915 [Candidatus Wolfebacteria bacterium]|nr:hypothetical protein [Candidatus Wolfebacteria bacterium]